MLLLKRKKLSKRFFIFISGDPIDFLSWFLNQLHLALNGTKKQDSSIIYKSFLGSMRMYTRKIPPTELDDKQKAALLLTDEYQEKITESPFLYLTCDLPPPPLFKDEFMENIIPQVSIYNHHSNFVFIIKFIFFPLIFFRLIYTHFSLNLILFKRKNTKLTKKIF